MTNILQRSGAFGVAASLLCGAMIAAPVSDGWAFDPSASAAPASSRFVAYLNKGSPLTEVEAILGIDRRARTNPGSLSGVPYTSATAVLNRGSSSRYGGLLGAWGEFRSGRRLTGVRESSSWGRLFGFGRASASRQFYGTLPASVGASFGRLAFGRRSNNRRIMEPRVSDPTHYRSFGIKWNPRSDILSRQLWRSDTVYGRRLRWGPQFATGRRLSLGRTRSMFGPSERTPASILNRGALGRRSLFSGRRIFGL